MTQVNSTSALISGLKEEGVDCCFLPRAKSSYADYFDIVETGQEVHFKYDPYFEPASALRESFADAASRYLAQKKFMTDDMRQNIYVDITAHYKLAQELFEDPRPAFYSRTLDFDVINRQPNDCPSNYSRWHYHTWLPLLMLWTPASTLPLSTQITPSNNVIRDRLDEVRADYGDPRNDIPANFLRDEDNFIGFENNHLIMLLGEIKETAIRTLPEHVRAAFRTSNFHLRPGCVHRGSPLVPGAKRLIHSVQTLKPPMELQKLSQNDP